MNTVVGYAMRENNNNNINKLEQSISQPSKTKSRFRVNDNIGYIFWERTADTVVISCTFKSTVQTVQQTFYNNIFLTQTLCTSPVIYPLL